MKRIKYSCIAILFCTLGVLNSCNVSNMKLSKIDLVDLEGKEVHLEDLKGKPIFLNFWATWCPPCRQEKPAMERARQILEKEGFQFVMISQEDIEVIKKFHHAKPYGFKYLKTMDNIKLLGVFEIPQTYVYNSDGEVVFEHTGMMNWDSPETLQMLREVVK
ncbi:MAG: TlpA disulfide reductase family protein [Chitinophagales bacterium]